MLYGGCVKSEMIVIRNPDKKVYKKFKQLATEEDMSIGQAITKAMIAYIDKQASQKQKVNIKNLQKLEGFIKPGKKVTWSEEIDKSLYG
jgi:hypothetical protein